MAADAQEFEYRRWRQIEAGLVRRLMAFASENFGPEVVAEAWKIFNDNENLEQCDPSSEMNMVFMPWFLFSWTFQLKPPGKRRYAQTTVAEQFLTRKADMLNDEEKELLRSAIRVPYTLCEIVEVKPGAGMVQFDLLRRVAYEVVERSASQTIRRGEIIYCATTETNGLRSNLATSPYALRPTAKGDILRLRKRILDQTGADEITTNDLHEFEPDIRQLYLDHLESMFTPPRLANMDGDPLVPQKVYFHIESADEAFYALKDLAKGAKVADLLRQAEMENGLVVKADIPWLGGREDARKRLGGSVLLGNLKIDRDTVIAEVNSIRRAARIRRLIEKRLGSGTKYKRTVIEPIESQFQERWKAAVAGSRDETGDRDSDAGGGISLDDSPELRVILQQKAKQHWDAWFNLPVPALNNMTPRQAAGTEEGRDLLESLLLLYESHATANANNLFQPDVPALRRKLGMN
jgi:hypothetical protein